VVALLNQFKIPGIRVLQFELGSDLQGNSSWRASHPVETVTYTGTHDNDTTAGWYESLPASQQEALRKTLKVSDREIVWAMIRAALASPASTAIVPAQDLLGLGTEARMNFPGVAKGNWRWRLKDDALNEQVAQRLRNITLRFGRLTNGNLVPTSGLEEGRLTPQIGKRAYAPNYQ